MSTEQPTHKQKLAKQAAVHGAAFLSALGIWAAFDSWTILSKLPIASAAAFVSAIAAGLILSHLIHEWGHFLGACLTKSKLTIKEKISPLFFDFDYLENNARQYLCLSAGGPVGNIVLILTTVFCIPMDNLGRQALLATMLGHFVYVLILELPVSRGILAGKNPIDVLSQHFGQGAPLFRRAERFGVLSGLAFLLVL